MEGRRGVGPFAAKGLWAPVTDGWPPHWVAVATRSVVRLIRSVDSVAKIKRHCGRWSDGWRAGSEQERRSKSSTKIGVLEEIANTDIFRPNSLIFYAIFQHPEKGLALFFTKMFLEKPRNRIQSIMETLKVSAKSQTIAIWICRLLWNTWYSISPCNPAQIYTASCMTTVHKNCLLNLPYDFISFVTFYLFINNASC